MEIKKVIYTAKVRTVGGREGSAKSDDEKLDIKLTPPGLNGQGTNPEQLFAAGWSACYIGALGLAAKKLGIVLPKETYVDAEVDLGTSEEAFLLQARLFVALPGINNDTAEQIMQIAHETCPYSKATRSNIPVSLTLIQ